MSAALSIAETMNGVITKKGATVSDAIKALNSVAAVVEAPTAPLPGTPRLSAEVVQTLKSLPALLDSLELPDTHREMTKAERESVIDAAKQIKEAVAGLAVSLEQIKVAAFNHFDAVARSAGKATMLVPRTKEGWLVITDKESFAVDGQDDTLTREVRNGSAILTEEALSSLVAEEEIDHKTYLRWTKQVRVVDEDAIMADLKKKPTLIGVIAKAAKTGAASAALYVRKANAKKK